MKADEYARKIEYIAAANQSLVKVDSLELLLPKILEIAEQSAQAEASSFLRHDPETGMLLFELVRNKGVDAPATETLQGVITLKPGEGIAGKALQERRTIIVDNVSQAEHFSTRIDSLTGYTTKSILCVPVLHLGEPLGVIQLLNPKGRDCFEPIDARALEIFASMAAVAIVRAKYMQEQIRQKELQAQLDLTAKIQQCCWPEMPEMGHGSHVWGRSHPARQIGGDLYDVIPLSDGSFVLYLADVSGKGLPAGFVMAALWSTMRSEARKELSAAELLENVNAMTFPFLSREVIITTICLVRYWPASGRTDVALGGHNPPLLMSGKEFRELSRLEGLPLGTVERFEFEGLSLTLPPGGLLLMYSDGVNEAFSPQGEMFGVSRFMDVVRQAPRENCGQEVFAALENWARGAGQSDDATLLALWRE